MKKKKLLIHIFLTIIILVIIFILSIFLDDNISITFSNLRNPLFDDILLGVSFISTFFILILFVTTLFFYSENKRRWVIPLWLTILVTSILGFLLKEALKRPRPFETGLVSVIDILFYRMLDNFNTWNFSFPSMHAMLTFCVLPIISKEFRKFRFAWIIFSFLVVFSRVYFGVHYFSDVLFGAMLGYGIGYITLIIEEKYESGTNIMHKLRLVRNV